MLALHGARCGALQTMPVAVAPFLFGNVYLGLGDKEKALTWIEKGVWRALRKALLFEGDLDLGSMQPSDTQVRT
jgi:hypothetical protein